MYNNSDDCDWLIEVDRNHVVQLSFEVSSNLNFRIHENFSATM